MMIPLLSTKFQYPRLPADWLPRPRLDEKFNRDARVILLCAPPGFGKTSIVVDWLNRQSCLAAWLSLDDADNDPVRFFSYLATALQSIDPGLGKENIRFDGPLPQIDILVTGLINHLNNLEQCCLLVLDDYQSIHNPDIHQALTFLIERQPPNLQLVLITREDPPLPLARLRARREMSEIRSADLRFSLEETSEFLSRKLNIHLPERSIAALAERTEGWVAGLQMAILALQGTSPGVRPENFIATFRGNDRYVMDYLMDEVFARQSPDLQNFLLHTAILDRLTAPLCDQLLAIGQPTSRSDAGLPASQDSQQILETLERMNLFLQPLDNRREWYRYHPLFADLLTYRLQREHPDWLFELHHRASIWFLQAGDPDQAIKHAISSGSPALLADTAEQVLLLMTSNSRLGAYLEWLKRIPDSEIFQRAYLCACSGWAYVLTFQMDQAVKYVQAGMQALSNYHPVFSLPEKRWVSQKEVDGHLASIQSFIAQRRGDFQAAIEHAHQAMEKLPEDAFAVRCAISLNLALLHYESRSFEEAQHTALEAILLAQQSGGSQYVATSALRVLGGIAMTMGKLNEATGYMQRSLEYPGMQTGPIPVNPSAAASYQWLVEVYLQRDEINTAQAYLDLTEQHLSMAGYSDPVIRTFLYKALLDMRLGNLTSAEAHLRNAEEGLHLHSIQDIVKAQWRMVRGAWLLARGDHTALEQLLNDQEIRAGDFLESPSIMIETPIQTLALRLPCYLLLAQALWGKGEPVQAIHLAEQVVRLAEHGPEFPTLLEGMALLAAIPRSKASEIARAQAYLEQALNLAAPEGYVRPFLFAGPGLIQPLRKAIVHNIQPVHAQKLLETLQEQERAQARQGMVFTQSADQPAEFPEPLTAREQQILRLLSAGLSSTEIANELYLSVSTIRTYIKLLYQKIGAHSREEAVEIGHRSRLI